MGLFKTTEGGYKDSNQKTNRDTQTSGNSSGSSEFSSSPIIPDQWQNDYDKMGTWLQNGGGGAQDAQAGLGRINETYNPYFANEGSYTLNSMVDKYGYQAPQDVTAQQVSANQVAAGRGLDFSKGYENQYTDNVVNRTMDNYDVGANRSANAFRAGSIGGGQGGNARQSLAAGVAAGESARNRGMLEADMRMNAQNQAFGFGMGDANRDMQGQGMNQQANLNAAQYNSGQDMQAQQYNAGRLDQRQMFDANMAEQGTQRRMDAVNSMEQNVLAQGMLGNDQFNQGIQYLNQGTAMFGNQGTASEEAQFDEQEKTKEEIDANEAYLKSKVGV